MGSTGRCCSPSSPANAARLCVRNSSLTVGCRLGGNYLLAKQGIIRNEESGRELVGKMYPSDRQAMQAMHVSDHSRLCRAEDQPMETVKLYLVNK